MIRETCNMRRMLIVLCGFVLLSVPLASGPACDEPPEEQTITGEVMEYETGESDGAVTAVSIFDDSWGEVVVANRGKGVELLHHVGASVEATGPITETPDGEYIIEIHRFTILQEDSQQGDEDDSDS